MKGKTTYLLKAATLLIVALFSLTEARAQQTLPFYEDFDGHGQIGAWSVSNIDDNTGLYEAGVDGSICFGFAYNTNPPQYLISPEFDGASAMVVSFDYIIQSAYWPETFQVGYSTTTNDVSAFTWSEEVTATNDSEWLTYEENFPAGTKYVAIRYNSNDMYYLYLDNFSFVDPSAPSNLTVSQVTATSANISWDGNVDSYNLRYATATGGDSFFEDFENGLDAQGWTTVRNAAGIENTDWRTYNPAGFEGSTMTAHSGSYAAMSRSWASSAYNVDNWLISPKVTLDGIMTYWVMDDGEYHEHYDIYVSTTTTDISAFTKVYEPGNASGSWTMVTVDLSSFAGQEGYVAFRHTDNDQDFLFIDDVTISTPVGVSGSWTTINNVTSPYALVGLTPEAQYAVEVQAVSADGESEWVGINFTTASTTSAPTDLAATDVKATSATLDWAGSQESYNLRYAYSTADPTAPATIIFTAGDVWGDGSGYQMLLDADATAYGTIIPGSGGLTSGGDVSAATYAEFEYKIPTNADGALATENIVLNNTITIEIPAGTYDWCITNPTVGDRMWIAGGNGDVDGRYNDFVFEPGATYEFSVQLAGEGDGVFLTVDRPMSEWTVVENVTAPYELTGLTSETNYEWQVQGILSDGTTEWSDLSSFTTLEAPASVTIGSTGYTTFVAPSDVSFPADVTAYIVTATTETAVILEEVSAIPAGAAVVVKGEAGTYYLDAATSTDDMTSNLLLPSDGTVQGGTNIYALANKADGVGFYPVSSSIYVPAGKGYLDMSGHTVKAFYGFEEDDATAINNLNANVNANKTIYNVAGQRINKMQKGVNIINGKKILK